MRSALKLIEASSPAALLPVEALLLAQSLPVVWRLSVLALLLLFAAVKWLRCLGSC